MLDTIIILEKEKKNFDHLKITFKHTHVFLKKLNKIHHEHTW